MSEHSNVTRVDFKNRTPKSPRLAGELTVGSEVAQIDERRYDLTAASIDIFLEETLSPEAKAILEEERANTREKLIAGLSDLLISIDKLLLGESSPEQVRDELLKLREDERNYRELMLVGDIEEAETRAKHKSINAPPEPSGGSAA